MKKELVIVESPAKAKTLAKILGKGYELKASLGHIRDLPKSRLGVDVENNFEPKYVVSRDKSKTVKMLKDAVKEAKTVYLATDPDREGEAIAWHLEQVTDTDHTPYKRVVFHEITEEAIKQAFRAPRSIDMHLVDAQQARRILDRLVGYKISPLLWRNVRRGLSAGRVQSVALKIIVDREREIEKFVPVEYWTIEAELTKQPPAKKEPFKAMFAGLADGKKLEIHKGDEAEALKSELEKSAYSVSKVKTKKVTRQPAPPFITSTMQQEAWRRLHFSAKQTMAIAQQLYEGLPVGNEGSVGLITYMRTDSTHVAASALAEARDFIAKKYGSDYLPAHARTFAGRVKGAQEAHEAIRPTRIIREPAQIKKDLNPNQFRLYNLIWQRMVASQMAAATFDSTIVDIEAQSRIKTRYLFQASSLVNIFPGFIILYTEGRDEEEEDKEGRLPKLKEDDALDLIELFTEQKFTQPPPRFTEATLIKVLEQNGIGRPSTYAPILSTIQERDYVTKTTGKLKPTELGFVVNDLLVKHFPDIDNIDFTARMEDELDKIAHEELEWTGVVKEFYEPLQADLETASKTIEKIKIADEQTGEACPKCGKPIIIKTGRFGKFLACSGFPECKYTSSFVKKTGAKCPECGSELIQRQTKKRRTFYGCSGYPNCKFISSYKPLPKPCPDCGGLQTVYREKWSKCAKCGRREKLEQDKSDAGAI